MRAFLTGFGMVGALCCLSAYVSTRHRSEPSWTPTIGTHPAGVGPGKVLSTLTPAVGHQLAAFSAGCFWGTEETFRRVPGVTATAVGYMGGTSSFPTYQQSHATGHAETVLVEFDPKKVSYEDLLKTYWTIHHPTSRTAVKPDSKSPYRSSVWTYNSNEQTAALGSLNAQEGKEKTHILTRVQPAMAFYLAEDYHQQYNERTGSNACPIP